MAIIFISWFFKKAAPNKTDSLKTFQGETVKINPTSAKQHKF